MSGFIQPSYFTNGLDNPYGFVNPVYITNYNDFKYTIGAGLNDTDNTLSTVGNPAIQLVSNSLFANDNLVSIQSRIDLTDAGANTIYISTGSYTENLLINNKYNIGLLAPNFGNTICEVLGRLEITGTSEIIRISNLQFEGTGNLINGKGRHFLERCSFQGSAGNINTLTISGFDQGKYITFENCEFDNYCAITVANTFAGVLFFINCNFGGATITLNQVFNQQVIFNNCAGFTSFPASTDATLIGINVLTAPSAESLFTATSVSATLNSPCSFNINTGSSIINTLNSVNQVLTTNGVQGLKLTPIGGPSSFYNVMYENGQQTAKLGTSISLFSKVGQANIIPELKCLIQFIANFSTTQDCIITFELIDDLNPAIPLDTVFQTVRNNGPNKHYHIPVNFDFVMPYVYTLNFTIRATAEIGDIETTTTDFYSIIFNEIQPA